MTNQQRSIATTGDLLMLRLEARGIGSGARVFYVRQRGRKWAHLVPTGYLAMGIVRQVRVPVAALGSGVIIEDTPARVRYEEQIGVTGISGTEPQHEMIVEQQALF